jgi:heat-inducible transcriptional repressor
MNLDARKQTILQAIVIEYVTGAEPIGSELLTQKYELGVKAATVRNEMAELSELGLLEQPHTSAGRIPSDLGYRYYVDRLIVTRDLSENERAKMTDATSDGDVLLTMLRDTVRALSRATHLLSVATIVKDAGLSVRTAVVSALGPTQALVVLVLSNGHVENRMVECPVGLTLQDVGKTNELLQAAVTGQKLTSLARSKPPTGGGPAIDKLVAILWGHLRSVAKDLTRGVVITEGEEFMFAQPEFYRDASALGKLLKDLSDSDLLYEAVSPEQRGGPVTIGRENRAHRMQQFSVVRQKFHIGENEAGVIALVGPTRMRYDRGIPLISFTAQALSDSLTKYFG